MRTAQVNAASVLSAAVATAGTFTVPYPAGFTAGDFAGAGVGHKLSALQVIWTSPKDFTIALNAASATVTWKASQTLPAGTSVRVEFDQGGVETTKLFADNFSNVRYPITKAVSASALLINLGSPTASTDNSLYASATMPAGGAQTLITAGKTFDVPRNLIWTSSGDSSGITATVVGKDEYNQVQTETLTGPNATVAAGKKAFKTITSFTTSGAATGNQKLGYGNVLGLPVHLPSTAAVLYSLQNGLVPSNAPARVAGLDPLTTPAATTADERGTFAPNTNAANVPDGARGYSLVAIIPNPTFIGSTPFGN